MNKNNAKLIQIIRQAQREARDYELKKRLIEKLDPLGLEIRNIEISMIDDLGNKRKKPFVSICAIWNIQEQTS